MSKKSKWQRGAIARTTAQRLPRRMLRIAFIVLGVPFAVVGLLCLLFVVNGTLLADGENPKTGLTGHPPKHLNTGSGETYLKVMSYNIAKAFVHKGGILFESPEAVKTRIEGIAQLISTERPDIVFLSETVRECGPCPVNQVKVLAEATGMHMWAFGENYNVGLPFYRLVGGNAILSRWPLEGVRNLSLAGRKPFYVTKNNRRALWCETQIGKSRVLLASLHNDSFNPANNLAQTKQLPDFVGEQEALLAGDFNATPNDASMTLLRDSGLFSGVFDGPPTFPADNPVRTIDFILGPSVWEVLEHRVIQSDSSDHLPVVTVFRITE